MKTRYIALVILAALAPALTFAQTLPQSTQDRQTIANLQYQANLPGTDAATRARIAREITELQYHINTRPLIAPMPTLAPTWQQQPGLTSTLPQLSAQATAPLGATVFGSCDADRAVIDYLQQQLTLPSTTDLERRYDQQRIKDLQHDLTAMRSAC